MESKIKKIILLLSISFIGNCANAQTYYKVSSVWNSGAGFLYPKQASITHTVSYVVVQIDAYTSTYALYNVTSQGNEYLGGEWAKVLTFSATCNGDWYTITFILGKTNRCVMITNRTNGVRLIYDIS